MPLTRYILVATANWKDRYDPFFADIHGIFDDLEAANGCAKAVLSKEIGCYTIDYDEDGCLVMGEEEKGYYYDVGKRNTKKDLFKVQVIKHDIVEQANLPTAKPQSASFTKKIELYHFTICFTEYEWKTDIIKQEKLKDDKYFLSKHAALEYMHEAIRKHDFRYKGRDEQLATLLDRYMDSTSEAEHYFENTLYSNHRLRLDDKRDSQFEIIFREKPAKKGYIELANGKTQMKVQDWDGTVKGYNAVYPDCPLTFPGVEASATGSVKGAKKATPAVLAKTQGGKVVKKKASSRGTLKK
ncbi:hypothetical protein BJ508DRAFT_315829 [Ascobolus immersus RN42]|uniref:Uncharacterized protein n=1 Tax=Ascobolus immersus RN42 TaxID=1160509 RepID=A0A3N4HBR4_ASCIM|nr:hypothetical protein BJ508DRAFT_315829 [Ascobolus immersus RN42]